MGIPSGFIDWINILYSNPMISINVNNFHSEPFRVTRGIRQGCPLSPLLYTICVEGLANLIINNDCIRGISIGRNTVKIIQHADDTSICVTRDEEFQVLDSIFYTYSEGSGSKINTPNTRGLWLGTWKNRRDNPGNFKWTNQKLNILGIYFGNEVTPEDNWNERINKITCILCQWKRRFLTMKGKAVVVNSLVGSTLAYFGSVISCPDYIKKLDDVIWDFFWSGKPDKMKKDTIRGPANMGGVGLINIGLNLRALKLQWLQKYTVQQGKWKTLFDYWIKRTSGVDNLGWFVLNNPQKYSPYTPILYRDVINAFVQSGGRVNCIISCINEALEMPL